MVGKLQRGGNVLASVCLASVLANAAPVAAVATASPLATSAAEVAFARHLDGMVFVVDYGPLGQPSLGQDVLTFADGTFASQGCERLGFAAAPYWLRVEGDVVHFRAEMTSAEHGTLAFTGRVENGGIEVASRWTRERWYRTVLLESWYQGRLAEPGEPLPSKH